MDTPDRSGLPERIGRYPILEKSSHGETGVVYLAEDPRLRRKIAIKVLPEAAASDPEALERFRREGRVLAALNHPNIATIHSFEEAGGACFLTMELVVGETLAQRLHGLPLPPLGALEICGQVAGALEAAHARGIVHRHLSPQNVKFTPEGQVKVLDFGIADVSRGEESDPTTASEGGAAVSRAAGTVSPEQLGGDPGDHRSDIWAFGSLLFECLTGRRIAPSDIEAKTERREPAWDLLAPETSDELRDLLKQCLADEPTHRPRDIGTVRQLIDREVARLARSVPADQLESIRRPNNLPLQTTSFVGRADEIRMVKRLLTENRLVTLTGMGGCGKTRLALEVAKQLLHRFPDGVWLVELGVIRDPNQVAQAAVQVLKLRDERGRSLTDTLVHALAPKTILLLLDGCEHLLSAVSQLVTALLRGAPKLCVLTTSREHLRVAGEVTHSVPPLPVPTTDDQTSVESLGRSEAVQLFVKRAGEARVGFQLTPGNSPSIAQICRRLDGIPLALELAATRVRVLPVEEIHQRLDDRFRLLRGGSKTAPRRLQTLQAAMDWSFDLLSEEERKLLRTLSVFAGGWTSDSAVSVCRDLDANVVEDLLTQLVEKSLVLLETPETGRARYRFLETVRQYAEERLAGSEEVDEAHNLHAEYFATLTEQAETEIRGPQQAKWLETLEAEQENLLAAITWCQSTEACMDKVFTMVRPLAWFWFVRGYLGFGRSVLSKVLALKTGEALQRERAQLLDRAGLLARAQADFRSALALHTESLAIYQQIGRQVGIVSALGNVANVAVDMGDYEIARSKLEEALAISRELGVKRGIANNLTNLAVIDNDQGRFESARVRLKEAYTLFAELGDMSSLAAAVCNLGISMIGLDQLESARALIEESVGIYRDLGEKVSLAIVLEDLARINARMGNHLIAGIQLRECLSLAADLGEKQAGVLALEGTGELASAVRQSVVAVQLLAAAHAIGQAIHASFPPRLATRRDALLDSLRSTLDDARFKKAWARGEAMSFESAIAFALDWLFGIEPLGPSDQMSGS